MFLKIENPGVAPRQAFTLLGASTKDTTNKTQIGRFGTGNKMGIATLLRNKLSPIVFAGMLKMEFSTASEKMATASSEKEFNVVCVSYSGRDTNNKTKNNKEKLGFVVEHGQSDWTDVGLALREFVSNALDRAYEEDELKFVYNYHKDHGEEGMSLAFREFQRNAKSYENVTVEIVEDNQVRAKTGFTRIFIPLCADVLNFYNNLGKWFLHFSEPALINSTLLPKGDRSLTGRTAAVIYRRGVRVREFESDNTPSLFDYNLECLNLDESRNVDDWYVKHEAKIALNKASSSDIIKFLVSLREGEKFWEHEFDCSSPTQEWINAHLTLGENGVYVERGREDQIQRLQAKGFEPIAVSHGVLLLLRMCEFKTADKILNQNELAGMDVYEATQSAIEVVDFVWNKISDLGLTNNKARPDVKVFSKIMIENCQILGLYQDGVVLFNKDIAPDEKYTSIQLLQTAIEKIAHHITGATDNSRDFQDFAFRLCAALFVP